MERRDNQPLIERRMMQPIKFTTDLAFPSAEWHRSSLCANGGCVEVARLGADEFAVRDSKRADSPVLTYDRLEWDAFIKGVKAGEFDSLPAPLATPPTSGL
jgi:hypothetical protein